MKEINLEFQLMKDIWMGVHYLMTYLKKTNTFILKDIKNFQQFLIKLF